MDSQKQTRNTVDSSCLVEELLSADIFKSIFKRLSPIDLVRLQTVSSYWNSLVEFHMFRLPCLILPSKPVIDGDVTDFNTSAYSGFLKLGNSQVSNFTTIPKVFREGCCVGSSNGWLVFLEDQAVPSLFHPFKEVQIQLPSLLVGNVLGLKKLEKNSEGNYNIEYLHKHGVTYKRQELQFLIRNLVVIGEPDHNCKSFGVIMFCEKRSNKDSDVSDSEDSNYVFLYYKGGNKTWTSTSLDPKDPDVETIYRDIIWQGDHLYVLKENSFDILEIEVWDLEDNILIKRRNIISTIPNKVLDTERSLNLSSFYRIYLIESCGDILLVVRFIEIFKDQTFEMFKYRTCFFQVYKLDTDVNEYVEIKSLGNRMLFVGGNQSVSVSIPSFPCETNSIYFTDKSWTGLIQDIGGCETNSIYFTDNSWTNLTQDIGDYDMGIYNLTNQDVKPILKFSSVQILPPYWIIPPQQRPS